MRAMEGKERALMALAQMRAQQIGAGGRGGRGAGAAAGGVDERIIAPMTRLRAGYSIRDLRKDMGPALDRLTQTMTGASEVMRIVDRLRTLVQRTGGGQNWATRVGGEIRSLAAQLKDAIRQASGMGALDNGALAMTEQIAGDPVDFTESMSTFLGRLQALRQVTFTRAKEHVRTIGQGRLEFDEREREAGFSGIPEDPDFEDLGDQPGEEDTFTGQFSTSARAIGRAVMREPGAASLSASPFGILSRSETFRNFVSSILSEDEQ